MNKGMAEARHCPMVPSSRASRARGSLCVCVCVCVGACVCVYLFLPFFSFDFPLLVFSFLFGGREEQCILVDRKQREREHREMETSEDGENLDIHVRHIVVVIDDPDAQPYQMVALVLEYLKSPEVLCCS